MSFTVSLTGVTGGHVAIFTEHSPAEFEVPGGHYLTSKVDANAAMVDVEPAFSVGKPAAVCTQWREICRTFCESLHAQRRSRKLLFGTFSSNDDDHNDDDDHCPQWDCTGM